jgi:hypothetical protein
MRNFLAFISFKLQENRGSKEQCCKFKGSLHAQKQVIETLIQEWKCITQHTPHANITQMKNANKGKVQAKSTIRNWINIQEF